METNDSESADFVGKSSIEEIEKKLEYELSQWDANGLHPARNVGIDPYLLNVKVDVLFNILEDTMSTEDIALRFKQRLLERLQQDRLGLLEQVRAGLVVAQTQLLGPNGEPLANGN